MEKNHDLKNIKNQLFYLNQNFVIFFLNSVFLRPGFSKFLKLVCLLNHINSMAAMLLLFPFIPDGYLQDHILSFPKMYIFGIFIID